MKKIRQYIKQFMERADIFLLVICTVCAVTSLFFIDIAGKDMVAAGVPNINPTKLVAVQLFSIVLGIGAFVIFTVIDADILGEQWRWLVGVQILLLIALVILGEDDGTGNKSWIRFAGIGIQPSEVIKIIYIVVSAKQMTYLKEYHQISSFSSIVQMALHFVAVFGAILVVSSDLGSATIIVFIFLVMLFALGVKLYWFALGGAAVAAMVPILWDHFLKDYQKQRLLAPYDDSIDPDGWGITWQSTQSQVSLASGRFTGIEEGHSTTSFTGKHTDFIFACIGEHAGMIACLIVITLLIVMIVHCARVGLHSGRTYDMLICFGVTAAVTFQTFINIGMCIGITPVIGITLPFWSYGGSSMVTMYAAMGLISGVKYKPKPEHFSML